MYARACVKESNVQRAKVYLGEIVRDRERERERENECACQSVSEAACV